MRSVHTMAVLLVAIFTITWGASSGVLAEPPKGTISVKVRNNVLHEIDPRLFGQFMERPSWGSEIGPEGSLIPGTHQLRREAKRLIRDMQIPIARFPGGTDVDYIDWLDMIDNVPGRPAARPITTGHTGNQVSNNFGYDEFLRLCEEVEMEPILVVNFRDGLLDKKGPERGAMHAAKLVAYCNARDSAGDNADMGDALAVWPRLRVKNGRPTPYGVKYFQIGNETWAFSRDVTQQQYITALSAYIDAMRAVDPTVEIIVDGQPAKLAARVYRQLGGKIAYFAVHHYQPWQIREVRRGSQQVEIGDLTARDVWYAWVTVPQIDAAGQSVLSRAELEQARRLGYPVAMTEWNWNGWWAQSLRDRAPLNSLFAKGIGAAGMLHAIMRQGDVVRIGAQSMLIGDGWGIHAICCDRHGRTAAYMVPSGQVTMLYSKHHGKQRLEVDLANVPRYEQPYRMAGIGPARSVAYLDVLATRDENTVYFHCINRHFDSALNVEIDVSALDEKPKGTGTLHVLEGRLRTLPVVLPGDGGESPAPGRIREESLPIAGSRFRVQLPARSVSVVVLPVKEVPLRMGASVSPQ